MRIALLVGVLLCAALSGCKKKTSAEYYRLEGEHSVLVTREGDAAYESAEMVGIIAGLRAVPADAVEKPKADALLATIANEQARVLRERTPPPGNSIPTDDVTARFAAMKAAREDNPTQNAVVEPVDAGPAEPAEPYRGMAEADFVKVFGRCYERGEPSPMSDGGSFTTQRLRADAKCQAQYGTPGAVTSWLFDDNGLNGKLVETTRRETTVVDSGAGEQLTVPQPVPEPQPILVIPGAPQPGAEPPPPPP